jgi:general secretion pathway protein G
VNLRRALIVLTIVLAVLVLAGLLLPTMRGLKRHPRVANTLATMRNIVAASVIYESYYGEWPTTLRDLDHNRSNIVFITWGQTGAKDGWERPIEFHPYTPSRGYGRVVSLGRDGRPGGEGLDADLEETFGRK